MNIIQGPIPVEDSLFQMENTSNSFLQNPTSTDLDIQNRKSLAKSGFFKCDECDGIQIPIAQCFVCKNTTIRQCVDCNLKENYGKHDLCKNLFMFSKYSSLINQLKKEAKI